MLPLVIQTGAKTAGIRGFRRRVIDPRPCLVAWHIPHPDCPTRSRGRPASRLAQSRYPLQPAVRAYCEYLATASKGAPTDEKTRLTIAQRQKIELDIAQKQGELLPAADVESTWTATLTAVRQAMLAVPSRVGERLPHLTAHDVADR